MRQQRKKDWTFGGNRERKRNIVIMAVWTTQDSRIDFAFTLWPAAQGLITFVD